MGLLPWPIHSPAVQERPGIPRQMLPRSRSGHEASQRRWLAETPQSKVCYSVAVARTAIRRIAGTTVNTASRKFGKTRSLSQVQSCSVPIYQGENA